MGVIVTARAQAARTRCWISGLSRGGPRQVLEGRLPDGWRDFLADKLLGGRQIQAQLLEAEDGSNVQLGVALSWATPCSTRESCGDQGALGDFPTVPR